MGLVKPRRNGREFFLLHRALPIIISEFLLQYQALPLSEKSQFRELKRKNRWHILKLVQQVKRELRGKKKVLLGLLRILLTRKRRIGITARKKAAKTVLHVLQLAALIGDIDLEEGELKGGNEPLFMTHHHLRQ